MTVYPAPMLAEGIPQRDLATPLRDRITAADFDFIREATLKRVEEIDPDRRAVLALSGGVDSVHVLFAMLETGRRPVCYTFHLGNRVSTDLASARVITKKFGLEHHIISVPREIDALVADAYWVIDSIDWSRSSKVMKSTVQHCHPLRYLYANLPPGSLMLGGGAGDHFYINTRQYRVYYHYGDDDDAYEMEQTRHSWACDPENPTYHQHAIAKLMGHTQLELYDWREWGDWIRQFTVEATDHPIEKWATVGVFHDLWRKSGVAIRPHSPYHVNSGIRDHHDLLMTVPQFQHHRAVIGVYNQIARELQKPVNTNPPLRDAFIRPVDEHGRVLWNWRKD